MYKGWDVLIMDRNTEMYHAAYNVLANRAAQNDELWHYGTPRHSGRYPYGSGKRPHQRWNYDTYSKDDSVFISGKVSYDEPLNDDIKHEIDKIIDAMSKILIGDAPGADTRVQDYLADKGYSNVVVYTTDPQVRNNVGNWPVKTISGNGNTDERLIRRQKDIAMTTGSTRGLAIMPEDDRPDSAMSLNVDRLKNQGSLVRMYDYKQKKWINT